MNVLRFLTALLSAETHPVTWMLVLTVCGDGGAFYSYSFYYYSRTLCLLCASSFCANVRPVCQSHGLIKSRKWEKMDVMRRSIVGMMVEVLGWS